MILFSTPRIIYSQTCNKEKTITICDMLAIDDNGDSTPDGIIDLYDKTGTVLTAGDKWSTVLKNAFVLNSTTGKVSVWDLRNSSIAEDNYVFTLTNPTVCGTDPVMIVNLILEPYSGKARTPDTDGINYYLCSGDRLDLFNVLASSQTSPAAHLNGTWSIDFPNSAANGILESEKLFSANVAYQVGLPLVDQDVYQLIYKVTGFPAINDGGLTCKTEDVTVVKIMVVRQVSAGEPTKFQICENEIIGGNFDNNIDLRDDRFLINEDVEGYWEDEINGDSDNLIINIRDLYTQLVDNGNNERFGCQEYAYTYTVKKRSTVCEDASESVTFTIYEQLRPFQQETVAEICEVKDTGTPVMINLIDFVKFTDGFDYSTATDVDSFTHWEFVSGPTDLGLIMKRQPTIGVPLDLACIKDPAIKDPVLASPYYDSKAPVTINGAVPGEYKFKFIVCPDINGCTGEDLPCSRLETEVVLIINEESYAGEDTKDLNFCITQKQVDLRSLLTVDPAETLDINGTWTNDENGEVVDNNFVFPDISLPKKFELTYTVENSKNCTDSAKLSFTIFEEANAGMGKSISLCADDLTITLFDQLDGNPSTTGLWSGPFGYISKDHLGVFDLSNATLPVLGQGTYTYTVAGNPGCTKTEQATVNISISYPAFVGDDINATYCKLEGGVNLFSLLDDKTVRTGVFEDTDDTKAINSDGLLEFKTLTNGIYTFKYVAVNALPCAESSLIATIQIIDLPVPVVPVSEFCILDAKHLDDIVVEVAPNYNWYETLESNIPIINNPKLYNNQVYYVANVDANNCESERLEVKIKILNIGEKSTKGELCTLEFQHGVSPNGDNQNDTFDLLVEDLYNIPEAFPDFELQIFNRHGAEIYKGNSNTQEFRGECNVSLRLGDNLTSGTYYYIFTPNFENNLPIQGSFYLSK